MWSHWIIIFNKMCHVQLSSLNRVRLNTKCRLDMSVQNLALLSIEKKTQNNRPLNSFRSGTFIGRESAAYKFYI